MSVKLVFRRHLKQKSRKDASTLTFLRLRYAISRAGCHWCCVVIRKVKSKSKTYIKHPESSRKIDHEQCKKGMRSTTSWSLRSSLFGKNNCQILLFRQLPGDTKVLRIVSSANYAASPNKTNSSPEMESSTR